MAHHLGRALQLTNILRDIDEDAAIGRLYLPREYLEEMDCCRQMDPVAIVAKPEIDEVCRKVAALAHLIMTRPAVSWRPSPRDESRRPG